MITRLRKDAHKAHAPTPVLPGPIAALKPARIVVQIGQNDKITTVVAVREGTGGPLISRQRVPGNHGRMRIDVRPKELEDNQVFRARILDQDWFDGSGMGDQQLIQMKVTGLYLVAVVASPALPHQDIVDPLSRLVKQRPGLTTSFLPLNFEPWRHPPRL